MIDHETVLSERVQRYRELVEQLDSISQIEPPRQTDPTATPATMVRDQILEQVAAGKALTTKALVDVGRRAVTEQFAGQAASVGLLEAKRHLEGERARLATEHRHVVFEALHEALAELVETARNLEPLAELETAESAIAADRVADYRAWTELRTRYEQIRSAQVREQRNAFGDLGGPHPLALFLKDPAAAFADYFAWKPSGDVVAPWPVTDDQTGIERHALSGRPTVLEDASAASFLAWAIEHDAEQWVPTPRAFQRACRELDQGAVEDRERRLSGIPARGVPAPVAIR